MRQLLHDIFSDLPGLLQRFVDSHGAGVYALLFAIVFCETGLVITPFLPGDSLFFAVGALCVPAADGSRILELQVAAPILFAAAIIGNTSNYWIGRATGPRIFRGESGSLFARLLSRKHLAAAHRFYERHGGKAVILGQFLPIIRTFVPYVAGAGAMNYPRFMIFNILGAGLWVSICVGAGYLFGNIPWVKQNFELVVMGIIAVSVIPVIVQVIRTRFPSRAEAQTAPPPESIPIDNSKTGDAA
ncbi:Protein DedA [Phycisphaerales bacterium]|nr:Protein DedA [Phycisphaerales bacterium]